MAVQATIAKADEEIARGRLWRAKEILGSSIVTYGYSREVLFALARVLLMMGDDLEAGKYLLLSVDSPSETELHAIQVFLKRFAKLDWQELLAGFPASARMNDREAYPEYLRNYLCELGMPLVIEPPLPQVVSSASSRFDWLFGLSCLFLSSVLLILILVGGFTVLSWLWQFAQ